MIRARSMESLDMFPEDAKLSTSFLRLSLSEKLESPTESEFQSYIGKHHQFPYHKAVHLSPAIRSKPIPIIKKESSDSPRCISVRPRKPYLIVRQRCDSSPSTISCNSAQVSDTPMLPSSYLCDRVSKSAPPERNGFLQRFVPAFLRRRLTSEDENPESGVALAEPDSNNNTMKSLYCNECTFPSETAGYFAQTFSTKGDGKMDNFILMSMR